MDEDTAKSKFVLETEEPGSRDLSKFKGLFYMADWSVQFTGLRRMKGETHAYEILNVVFGNKQSDQDLNNDGHFFEVTTVKDDSGHPFIKFNWYTDIFSGYSVIGGGWLLAKKWEDGISTWKEVSAEEKDRLGWGVNDEVLMRRAEEEEEAEKAIKLEMEKAAKKEKVEESLKKTDEGVATPGSEVGPSGALNATPVIQETGQKRERSESVAKSGEDTATKKVRH